MTSVLLTIKPTLHAVDPWGGGEQSTLRVIISNSEALQKVRVITGGVFVTDQSQNVVRRPQQP